MKGVLRMDSNTMTLGTVPFPPGTEILSMAKMYSGDMLLELEHPDIPENSGEITIFYYNGAFMKWGVRETFSGVVQGPL